MSIRHSLIRTLKYLATGSFSLFLAACYGVPMGYGRLSATDSNGDSDPIRALRVSYQGRDGEQLTDYTDDNGMVYFYAFPEEFPISGTITDVDAAANGGPFDTQSFTVDEGEEITVEME